jgi:uncharacterized protein YjbI with pentapeptide repeats
VEVNGYQIAPGSNLAGVDLSDCQLGELTSVTNSGDFDCPNGNDIDMVGSTREAASLQGAHLVHTNLSKAQLCKVSFVGADLSGANLADADLRWANFTDANLTGADLSGADISGAVFTRANMVGVSLRNILLTEQKYKRLSPFGELAAEIECFDYANMSGVDLSALDLSDVNFRGADLSGANLTSSTLLGTNFAGAQLVGATLTDTVSFEANFGGANLSGVIAERAKLENCNLYGAHVESANFEFAELRRADFTRCSAKRANFRDANLVGAALVEAFFNHADFTRANLEKADLASAVFVKANLSHAKLAGANLGHHFYSVRSFQNVERRRGVLSRDDSPRPGAKFMSANLQFAVLDGCDLTGASFVWAILSNASLVATQAPGAIFMGANLIGADFQGSVLEFASFSGAVVGDRPHTKEEEEWAYRWLHQAESDHNYSDGAAFPDRQVAEYTDRITRRTNFAKTRLRSANFIGVAMDKADFAGADLRDIQTQ